MRRVELIAPLLATLAIALTAGPGFAQIEVTAIGRDVDPLDSTDQVRHFSFDEGFEVEQLKVGQVVGIGDELTALGEDLFVELECPAGTLLRLTGTFRVAINQPEAEQDCRIESRDGKLDLLSENATQTCVAGVCLATGGTRYALRFSRGEGGVESQVLVFEGSVGVVAGGRRAEVGSSQRMDLKQGAEASGQLVMNRPQAISRKEVKRWAELYATFDVVRARTAGVPLAEAQIEPLRQEFQTLHAQVLEKPDEEEPRAELAAKQVAYRLDREALYNAKQSGLVSTAQLQQSQIDASQLRQGDPRQRQRFETLIRDQRQIRSHSTTHLVPSTQLQPVITHQPTIAVMAPSSALDVNPPAGATADQIVEFWKHQLELYEPHRQRNELTSRGHLIVARAHLALRDRAAAKSAAVMALRLTEQDRMLIDDEVAAARRLASIP